MSNSFVTLRTVTLPGSSVHGILQARILEQVAISSSRVSSLPRDQTHVSCISCIGRQILLLLSHLVKQSGKLDIKLVHKHKYYTGHAQKFSYLVGNENIWRSLLKKPFGNTSVTKGVLESPRHMFKMLSPGHTLRILLS